MGECCGYGHGDGPKNPIIYIFPVHANPKGDCLYVAVAQDGEELASHVSSSPSYGMFDMGLKGDRKHDIYRGKYPGGFSLQWVDDWKSHPLLSERAKDNESQTK